MRSNSHINRNFYRKCKLCIIWDILCLCLDNFQSGITFGWIGSLLRLYTKLQKSKILTWFTEETEIWWMQKCSLLGKPVCTRERLGSECEALVGRPAACVNYCTVRVNMHSYSYTEGFLMFCRLIELVNQRHS